MDTTVKILKAQKNHSTEKLQDLTKDELIAKIQSLEAHNVQLQNILNKTKNIPPASSQHCRSFDFSKCQFRHVLLHLFYLGWDYQGFAVQEDTTNTIEHHLFQALSKTCLIKERTSSNYHRCGRTDKGVSSFGQVISIDLRSKSNNIEEELDYCKLLNRVLPANIQCVAWAPADSDFSARFNCKSRTYKYYFPKGKLDIQKMDEACKLLLGSHDFRNFARMDVGNGVVQFVRNILDFQIKPVDLNCVDDEYSMYVAVIKGNAFLWHQIRFIMGVLFLIGSGKEAPSLVTELLDVDKNPRKPDYNMASELPLNLFFCEYEDVKWQTNQDTLNCVLEKLQACWTTSTIKSVMTKEIIESVKGMLATTEDSKCLSKSLFGGMKSKNYVSVMKRQKCDSLEDKIKHFTKRKRIEVKSNKL